MKSPLPAQLQSHPDHTVIEYYEGEIPAFVEAELSRLYGNIYAALPQLQISGALEYLHIYVVRKNHIAVTVLLLRKEARRVRVLNEGIKINDCLVAQFSDYIFRRFSPVGSISFNAVEAQISHLPFPHHQFDFLEDIVLTMPGTTDAYFSLLGKSTQRFLTRYLHKLKRDYPGFQFEVQAGAAIQEQHVRKIMQLNQDRMAGKHKQADTCDRRIEHILRLSRRNGFIGLIRIKGEIFAGTINFRERDNFFLNTVAHDSGFDDYRLGTLCCYLTICECIRQGGNEYHFLWGEYDYKYRLKGQRRRLDHLVVYRSRRHLMLDMRTVAGNVRRDYTRRFKRWLHAIEKQAGIGSRFVHRASNLGRAMRRHLLRWSRS